MVDSQEKRWLKILAGEIMDSLAEVRRRGGGLSEEVLAEVLGESRDVRELIEQVCQGGGLSVKKDEKSLSFEELQKKYNDVSEELRHSEGHCHEIEEAFKALTMVLAGIAYDENQPGLNKELKSLKASLRQKAVPARLEASSATLKNYIIHSELNEESEEESGDAAPEGVEDNIRDILVFLVNDISLFEDPAITKQAKLLARRIRHDFTLEDHAPFMQDIHDLIFRLKDVIRQEKRKLYGFSMEIISKLEDTEKDLLRTIDKSTERLGPAGDELERKVNGEMESIQASFDAADASIETIRRKVFEKIAGIRRHFQKKREEDQAEIERMSAEKTGVEKRLADIHRRYQEFSKKSKALVEEMEKFRQASMSDALTGIFNRRAYDLHVKKALEEFRAGNLGNLCLIVFDIDHFKDFNNSYGHRAGDKILVYVSRLVRENLRKEDLFFRYGGDEFVILLPEANLRNSAKIAQKIRAGINQVEFKIYKGSDKTVRIGLSLGVAAVRKDDTPESVFQRADQALYLSKEKGRNQVRTEKEVKS